MKILIAYATKSGTTEDAAKMLAAQLSAHEVTLCNLATATPDIAPYDAVILGSFVRMGKIHKAARALAEQCINTAPDKRIGLYLCCCFANSADDYFIKCFPAALRERALSCLYFGGETRIPRQKGLDKLIMRIVVSAIRSHNRDPERDGDIPMPALLPENICRMADSIKQGVSLM